MSKTWEHYHYAARHHERAAYHYDEAARLEQANEHEKSAHHAYLAHGHAQHAIQHDGQAAQLHVEHCDDAAIPTSKKQSKKDAA